MIKATPAFDNFDALIQEPGDFDPIRHFQTWHRQAGRECAQANAMFLATTARNGAPSCRVVLLKNVDDRGFVFFTNYRSRKAKHIGDHSAVALTFWWQTSGRQVRIEGVAKPVSAAESDAYFASRPRDSQLGAHASRQSQPIPTREALDTELKKVRAQFHGREVPRPPHWGGYVVEPHTIEFWQQGQHRLHDRLQYTRRPDGRWAAKRLSP